LLRRLAAILLIAIILFNFYGYRLVISCMQSNSEAYIEKQVDKNNYNEQELISIKTKLNLPYYTSSSQFERTYGSITINGNNYQYVKRRVLNDTLELLCLPNPTKTKLESVDNELTKALADGQASTPKKNSTIKITLPDFFQSFKNFTSPLLLIVSTKYFSFIDSSLPEDYHPRQERPPQSMQFLS
jgi:hypothetical protein